MLYLPFSRLINLGIPAQVGRFRAVNVILNKLSTATIAKSRMNLTHAHFKQRPQWQASYEMPGRTLYEIKTDNE